MRGAVGHWVSVEKTTDTDALVSAQTADLGPGDAIYMPPLCWHHVRATSDFNLFVNFWWTDRPQISRELMEAFVLSLLSVGQLPAPEREAWRAKFDYFIFQTDGLPLDHILDELQGVLGSTNPQRAKAIWKFFTDMMREARTLTGLGGRYQSGIVCPTI